MSESKPNWCDLNAYADGELLPTEAAGVARAVAEDPALADQVATLARLKATVQEQGQVPLPAKLADICGTTPQGADTTAQPLRRTWAWLGAAAATAAFIVLAAALLIPAERKTAQPAWHDFAVQLHQAWARAEPDEATEPSADALLASLSNLGQAAQVPDLSGARLTVGYVQPLASDHGQGLHVGYRGTRGCRVSLIVLPAVAGLPQKPVMLAGVGRQRYTWRVGGLGYALLASGMEHSVHEASLKQAPVGPETRVALAESRARSRPCAA
jgi:anti-sigma factor RsiW